MSLLNSTYKPSLFFKNKHFNTVYKTLFYKQKLLYNRKRITTPDNDFLDLDFSTVGSSTLVVAMHGLEGSSNSTYILSVVSYLNSKKIDCVAVNFRGCSGEDNLKPYSYHSGKTDDITTILEFVQKNYSYQNIILLGYSMGGNATLKFMGENSKLSSLLKAAIAVSVPCDLEGSSNKLSEKSNFIYQERFMRTLRKKALLKIDRYPELGISKETILSTKNFEQFDSSFTAPLFGFKNAQDYWHKNSCKQFLPTINKPTLVLTAKDDPFLSDSCIPFKEAESHPFLQLEVPKYGGHVGFNTNFSTTENNWSETRIHNFITEILPT